MKNNKMQECFTPHVFNHSLFGLGVGMILVALVPALQNVWFGIVVLVVAVATHGMRK